MLTRAEKTSAVALAQVHQFRSSLAAMLGADAADAVGKSLGRLSKAEGAAREALERSAFTAKAVESLKARLDRHAERLTEIDKSLASLAQGNDRYSGLLDDIRKVRGYVSDLASQVQGLQSGVSPDELAKAVGLISQRIDDLPRSITAEHVRMLIDKHGAQDGESIEPMGKWSLGAYPALALVRHKGATWISKVATSTEPKDGAADWMMIAKDGTTQEIHRRKNPPTIISKTNIPDAPNLAPEVLYVSTDYTTTDADNVIVVTGLATITLHTPEVTRPLEPMRIKRFTDQLVQVGAVDGGTTYCLNVNYQAVDVQWTGTEWISL